MRPQCSRECSAASIHLQHFLGASRDFLGDSMDFRGASRNSLGASRDIPRDSIDFLRDSIEAARDFLGNGIGHYTNSSIGHYTNSGRTRLKHTNRGQRSTNSTCISSSCNKRTNTNSLRTDLKIPEDKKKKRCVHCAHFCRIQRRLPCTPLVSARSVRVIVHTCDLASKAPKNSPSRSGPSTGSRHPETSEESARPGERSR